MLTNQVEKIKWKQADLFWRACDIISFKDRAALAGEWVLVDMEELTPNPK